MKYFVIILQTLNLSQALFNNGHKYMPMGYKEKPKCPDIPAKKPSSSFEVFQFLSSMAIATNIAANIGVVHQIISPISNFESTNCFNEYLL